MTRHRSTTKPGEASPEIAVRVGIVTGFANKMFREQAALRERERGGQAS